VTLRLLLWLQGLNPWIEVDGGVSPKNSYKVCTMATKAAVMPAWICARHLKDIVYKMGAITVPRGVSLIGLFNAYALDCSEKVRIFGGVFESCTDGSEFGT
jgi:hypothetical protein